MQIINTRGTAGFDTKRRYDQDLGRLGDMNTAQRELHRIGDLNAEMRKMRSELNGSSIRSIKGEDSKTMRGDLRKMRSELNRGKKWEN